MECLILGRMSSNIGMGSFQIRSSTGKGGDRDMRTVHDDDERDRMVTRDRDRKRAERDNMERRDYWGKDSDPDRDRTRDLITHLRSHMDMVRVLLHLVWVLMAITIHLTTIEITITMFFITTNPRMLLPHCCLY